MASITIIDDLSPDTDAAIRTAVADVFPDIDTRICLCSEEPERVVIRVFLSVPNLKPSPYTVFAVDRSTHTVKILKGDDAKPYRIPNYK